MVKVGDKLTFRRGYKKIKHDYYVFFRFMISTALYSNGVVSNSDTYGYIAEAMSEYINQTGHTGSDRELWMLARHLAKEMALSLQENNRGDLK